MNDEHNSGEQGERAVDRLESYGIYQLALQLFNDFWDDSEMLGKDFRGRELARQQVRSLDSVCANIEEGYGRGYGKELPYHLKVSRGEARESKGRYGRCARLLPATTIQVRVATLDRIIGGLTKTINTLEQRSSSSPVTRHPSPPRHPSPATRHPQ